MSDQTLASKLIRFFVLLGIALAIATLATAAMGWLWLAMGGGTMSVHGWIALGLGMAGTVGMAWGLMALAFRSSREGWDDQVDNSLDPGLQSLVNRDSDRPN